MRDIGLLVNSPAGIRRCTNVENTLNLVEDVEQRTNLRQLDVENMTSKNSQNFNVSRTLKT